MKKLALLIIALTLMGTAHSAPKKKSVGVGKPNPLQLIPPLFTQLPEIVSISCGYVLNMGIRYYVVRGTSPLIFNESQVESGGILSACITKHRNSKLFFTLPEVGPSFTVAEITYDQVICSRQRALGFPETFTVVSTEWRYLHPERIRLCMELLLGSKPKPVDLSSA